MVEIYLIRHGQSKANVEHIVGTDTPLSVIGQTQAISARNIYLPIKFDKVYSSKLQRTRDTATRLFAQPISEDRQLEEFNEIWFGRAEGAKIAKTGIEGYTYQYSDNFVEFMKECEGDNPFERAKIAINKLQELSDEIRKSSQEYSNKRICIVTSDTLIRCIVLTLKYQKNWNDINAIKYIDNLDAMKFTYDNTLIKVERLEQSGIVNTLYESKN